MFNKRVHRLKQFIFLILIHPFLTKKCYKIAFIYVVIKYIYVAGWEVRMVKNFDRGLENFSGPRLQFFTIRTDPKPANNMFIFFLH